MDMPDRDREVVRRTTRRRRAALFTLLAGACLVASGCVSMGRAVDQGAVPADNSASLVNFIANQPYVTAEPAYRAAYALHHGEEFDGDYAELRAAMLDADLVAERWQHQPDSYLNRGEIGYLICRAAGVRTGVNWMLTGLGRYAYRELQYKRIAGSAGEWQRMSGGEFVGVLSRAEQYMREHGQIDVSTIELDRP